MIQQPGLLLVNCGNIFEGCGQGFICLWHLFTLIFRIVWLWSSLWFIL